MNTSFSYMYRDGDNFKQSHTEIFAGVLTLEQIIPFLDEETYFIPNDVGLLELQEQMIAFPTDADHVWHEITDGDIVSTEDDPTTHVTATELLSRFQEMGSNWDVSAGVERLGV